MAPKKDKTSVRTQICTINLAKRTHRQTFKKKAPRALREIKKFAQKTMHTNDVRVDPNLNKAVWATGVRRVPRKIRVKLSRRRKEDADEDTKDSVYTYVEYVPVDDFSGLQTEEAK